MALDTESSVLDLRTSEAAIGVWFKPPNLQRSQLLTHKFLCSAAQVNRHMHGLSVEVSPHYNICGFAAPLRVDQATQELSRCRKTFGKRAAAPSLREAPTAH